MPESADTRISRRNLLKIAGVAGVAAQAGGLVAAGINAGKSSESYTGWESFNPGTQFFDREPFEFEGPAHKPVREVRRPSHLTDYDLIVPPHAVEAGLGELGRTGFCITPEAGGNCRMAIVTTSLPMSIDKPIDFGVARFCKKCKLCAESCPSGSISMADSPDGMVIRGYEHWYINNGSCYNYWRETMGPMGCRLCVAVCPYSRKDNWIHDVARKMDSRDPTGAVSSGLLLIQKRLFDHPEAAEYHRPPKGRFASFRPEPPYMEAEKYLNISITKPNK